jgi:hypothetical protein
MFGFITRAFARRREIRDTVQRLIDQMEKGAWSHARDRVFSSQTHEDRKFWRRVQASIEAHDDRISRTSARRRARS